MTWTMIAVEISADGLITPRCQKCQIELDIHQPLEARPDQLLGTCSDCGAWYMIEVAPDGSEAFQFDMPGVDYIRQRLAEARTSGSGKRKASRNPRKLDRIGANGRHA